MDKLKAINWPSLVAGKHSWIDEHFKVHSVLDDKKVVCRFLSLDFSGTQQEILFVSEAMAESIEHYVFDEKQLTSLRKDGRLPFQKAMKFFGKTNPDMDGKYGELLLYLLTEKLLKTPLVSHKLSLITNTNDQVKGGDGIFFGSYKDELAILIGESKIHQGAAGAIDDALESLNRFYDNYSASHLGHEMFIARSNISENFSSLEDAESLYQAFTPGTEQYKGCIKAHPVLLVFESSKISTIEEKAKNKEEAEKMFSDWLTIRSQEIQKQLCQKLEGYSELKKIYIDVFLVPLTDISKFKHSLYREIHGVDYVSPGK
ncbi:Hachiman antiphage defense system protein HamA [Aeromonas enteropelogenes]|uniref:Hachiman antiphage defense system protein HamA n=1 Tax=Aeromonas enteropelogenes TaxID=29489 RepID=UPI003BA370C2